MPDFPFGFDVIFGAFDGICFKLGLGVKLVNRNRREFFRMMV